MTTPRDPRTSASRARLAGRMASIGGGTRVEPHEVVGIAHVAVGALGLTNGAFILLTSVDRGPTWMVAASVVALVLALYTVLAGLRMGDGRRSGAVVAVVVDGLRLAILVLSSRALSLDAILTAGLLGSVLWIWPTLGGSGPSVGSRPSGERSVR